MEPLSAPESRALESGNLEQGMAAALEHRVVGFSRLLRQHRFPVGLEETKDSLRVAERFLCTDFDAFRGGMRALLCVSVEQFPTFDPLFEGYWCAPDAPSRIDPDKMARLAKQEAGEGQFATTGSAEETGTDEPDHATSGASGVEVLRRMDFSQVAPQDQQRLEQLAARMWQRMALRLNRRLRGRQGKQTIHLRRTMRRNLSRGGDLLQLVYAGRKPRKPRLVVLLDVSGSMELYSFFLLRLLYALQCRFRRMSSFVFATDLEEVTDCLGAPTLTEALGRVARRKLGWSGGTRLGDCLHRLVENHARVLRPDTVFVVLSDGLDVGSPERLAQELRRVKTRTARIVWLNPLLGQPGYEPLAGGMAAALPLVDVFAPAHNIESLMDIGRMLRG